MRKITLAPILLLLAVSACKKKEHFYAYDHYPKFSDSLEWSDGPYKLNTLNKLYFIESFPYDAIYPSTCEHCEGITHVYTKSKIKQYTIPRYFKVDNIFLSGDGRAILYFNDNCSDSSWEGCSTALIQYYRDGKLSAAYPANSFGNAPDEPGPWLYNNTRDDAWLASNHLYATGDTVYAITGKRQVLRFSISSGKFIDSIHLEQYLRDRRYITYPRDIIGRFKTAASTNSLPELEGSSTIYGPLGKYLNAEVLTMEQQQFDQRKYYKFHITTTIGNNGRIRSLEAAALEDILVPQAMTLKTRIEAFLRAQKFRKGIVPYRQKEWRFSELIFVQKLPVRLAEREFLVYRDSICRLDRSSGIYIPANLKEAISELDKMLSVSIKALIKSGANMQSGLGMDIRNNWRLWSGSRFSCYFNRKGLYHPELMSAVILQAYLAHLRGNFYREDSLIDRAKRAQTQNLPCYQ